MHTTACVCACVCVCVSQAQVITKEGVIQQLVDQKAEMERRYGKPVQDRKTGTQCCMCTASLDTLPGISNKGYAAR